MKINKNKYRKCVGERNWVFPTFLFLLIFWHLRLYAQENIVPDFAFPITVETDSRLRLEEALNSGDGVSALRNAMNLIIAGNEQNSRESFGKNINLLDSLTQVLKYPCDRLCYLMEAQILEGEYQSNRYVYDNRNLPSDTIYPSNPFEWDGKMYKNRILQLVNKATSNLQTAPEQSISYLKSLLTNLPQAEKIGLTVPEFIAFKGASILKTISNPLSYNVIPFFPEEENITIEAESGRKAKSLLQEIITGLNENNSVGQALAMRELLFFSNDSENESLLRRYIKDLSGKEGSGILLYDLWSRYDQGLDTYRNIQNWLNKYPEGFYHAQLEYAVSEMAKKSLTIDHPQIVLPQKETEFVAKIRNMRKGYVLLYSLKPNEIDQFDNIILKKFDTSKKPLHIIELEGSDIVPSEKTDTLSIPGLPSGIYAIIPSESKTLPTGFSKASYTASYSTLRVTDLTIICTNNSEEKDAGGVYVVNGGDGKPQEGVTVSFFKGADKNPYKTLVTDKEGFVPAPQGYYRIVAQKGTNIYKRESGFSYFKPAERLVRHVSILTDLAVYRPGDTVRFAILGWEQDKQENRIVKNADVSVTLRDVNFSEAGEVVLKLNETGRASGEIVIPRGRLSGTYQLIAKYPEYPGGGGSIGIQVEEYKLPGFYVTLDQEDIQNEENLRFKGISKTYSGMPVKDGKVEITVAFLPWRWGYTGVTSKYVTSTQTNEDGEFYLELPVGNLKDTPYATGRYALTTSVTDQAGETESSHAVYFNLGVASEIRPSIGERIRVDGDTVSFHVPVYDMGGLPVRQQVEYTIVNQNDTKVKYSGLFESPVLTLNSDSLPSGKYNMEFKISGEEKVTSTDVVIWREDDIKAPYPTPLWIPQNQYTYSEGEKSVQVSFGTYWNDWILCLINDGEKIVSSKWILPSDTMQHLSVDIPGNKSVVFINLFSIHNLDSESGQIKIVSAKSLEKLEVATESFRNTLSAGDKEEWKFSFKLGKTIPEEINTFAVMSDKALNDIKDFKWSLNIWHPEKYNKVNISGIFNSNNISYREFSGIGKNFAFDNYSLPDWETYGYGLIPYLYPRTRGKLRLASMATMKNAKTEESTEMEDAVATMDAEAPAEAGGIIEDEEEISPAGPESIQLRPVEMPVAFFMTNLKSDEEGNVEVSFTVPDFNTTWQFQLAGYDAHLNNASVLLDAVANKPVMVKSNLPQFLRTGDKASVSATLFNNSDKTLPVTGKIEVADPYGRIIGVKEFKENDVLPSGSKVISIDFDVPDNLMYLVIKSMAEVSEHKDGEMGMVPVLPSNTPVTESKTFYALSGDTIVDITIPNLPAGASTTLKYCDNPIWDILLSLPGISDADRDTSLGTALKLYSELLSDKIVNGNDVIHKGLEKIFESGDSLLTMSALEKEEYLKITALNETPWVNQASSETLRIRGLQKYLDKGSVAQNIEQKIRKLKDLQNSDGGWSWCPGMKSSSFITASVIRVMAYLNDNGILPKDLQTMTQKAVRYYDTRIIENRDKSKELNVFTALQYLYSKELLKIGNTGSMKKIEKELLDSVANQWRHWNISNKVIGAVLLQGSAQYKEERRRIMKSLEQFVNASNTLEEEADMLGLFSRYGDEKTTTDKILGSMMLKKETRDWGATINAAAVINSIVKAIPEEIFDQRSEPEILIDGDRVHLSPDQTLTGNYIINIDRELAGKSIEIKRAGGTPAWGGIVYGYITPIKDVKSAEVENLAIQKRLLAQDGKGNLKNVKRFSKGEKITVVLNVTCKKDMDYVVISDNRPACLQPDDKGSGYLNIDGLWGYRSIGASKTTFYIENLPAGNHVISYTCHVDRDGDYADGIGEIQSLYSPAQVAHSAGSVIRVDQ